MGGHWLARGAVAMVAMVTLTGCPKAGEVTVKLPFSSAAREVRSTPEVTSTGAPGLSGPSGVLSPAVGARLTARPGSSAA